MLSSPFLYRLVRIPLYICVWSKKRVKFTFVVPGSRLTNAFTAYAHPFFIGPLRERLPFIIPKEFVLKLKVPEKLSPPLLDMVLMETPTLPSLIAVSAKLRDSPFTKLPSCLHA